MWDMWKKSFDVWENATAKVMEEWLKSPLVLGPSGTMLTMAMKMKAATDEAVARWWGGIGLPTKRDQERALHALNMMQSRILDLEEEIRELKGNGR
jgi:hypothetical protein